MEPLRVVVAYESRSRHTAEAANQIADAFETYRAQVRMVPLGSLAPERLVATDLLVIGTWVEGLVLAAVGPAKAAMAAIERLPRLAGMPVRIFCTNFNPGGTLKTLQPVIEARDSQVIETAAFGRWRPVTPRSFAAGCSRSFRSIGPAR